MIFAVGRELHLSDKRLLTMPLCKLYQFVHCALLYAGCNTDWKHATAQEQEETHRAVARLKKQRERS